jgi:uncharacterized membrane protein
LSAIGLVAAAVGVYYATFSLLLHFAYRSYGWDLGIFDQVVWNTAHGRFFEYSFRSMSYLGDHWSPVLVLLSPHAWLKAGPAPLLIVQGLALGAAAVPLFAGTRRLAGPRAAWLLSAVYLLGIPVVRAVTYDFHTEAFAPLLAFTAFWALTAERPIAFAVAALSLLLLKEDMLLLVLAMCWLAWTTFRFRRAALATAGIAVVHGAVVSLVLMPHFLGDNTNPLLERYGYLGDSAPEMAARALVHPGLLLDHLNRWSAAEAAFLLLAGVGFLPLLAPRLWPPLAALILTPMLAEYPQQNVLELHYGLVPAAFALVASAMALGSGALPRAWDVARRRIGESLSRVKPVEAAVLVAFGAALVLFALKAPLPPSVAMDVGRFHVDGHAAKARSFVSMIPDGAVVSAQATYVPHLSQRRSVFEFPRLEDATYVILDARRPVPSYDAPGFEECRRTLAAIGFVIVREEDGITLWRRDRASTGAICEASG